MFSATILLLIDILPDVLVCSNPAGRSRHRIFLYSHADAMGLGAGVLGHFLHGVSRYGD
jgi:hypothetical protein